MKFTCGGVGARLVIVLALACSLLGISGLASAQAPATADRGPEERALVERIAQEDPGAAARFEEATRALDAEDFARADEGFTAILARHPGLAVAMRRSAFAKSAMGQRTDAIALARKALAADPSADSRAGLAIVLLGRSWRGESTQERKEALSLARQATEARPDDAMFWTIRCEAAIALESTTELAQCAASLERVAPRDAGAQVYAALAAANAGEWSKAEEAIERAKALGAPPQATDQLSRIVDDNRGFFDRWGATIGYVLAGWLAAILVLVASGMILSHLTLRRVAQMAGKHQADAGKSLRSLYRVVLFTSSILYYVSLPIVLALVVVAAGGIIYGFFAIGQVPIKLVLIVGAIALVTVWAVLKSVFIRPKDEDPGERLDLDAHPRFRAVLQDVAREVGTRPVDTVYVTPSTDLGVFERGSLGKQLRGTTERCLVLGVGVLDGMGEGAFRAILAHEYGHFASRDTAGGGFALAVRRSLLMTAVGLAQNGAATWYNPAWWFVRGFHAVFLRVSQGASRLQEYLADRMSAMTYGPEAFVDGLTHVIKRSIAWDTHVQASLDEVIQEKRALQNLFTYTPKETSGQDDLERAWTEALERAPSPYDSHPCPRDRFVWVRSFAGIAAAPTPSDALAWDLMDDRAALERFMTDHVRDRIAARHGLVIPRDETPDVDVAAKEEAKAPAS